MANNQDNVEEPKVALRDSFSSIMTGMKQNLKDYENYCRLAEKILLITSKTKTHAEAILKDSMALVDACNSALKIDE